MLSIIFACLHSLRNHEIYDERFLFLIATKRYKIDYKAIMKMSGRANVWLLIGICISLVTCFIRHCDWDIDSANVCEKSLSTRSSEKFLSFYKETMDAHFSCYIILSNYVWSTLSYQDKDHKVWQIRFHICIKMRRCKRRVCKRKTLFGQSKTFDRNVYFFA